MCISWSSSVGCLMKINIQCCFNTRFTSSLHCLGIVTHRFILCSQGFGNRWGSLLYLFFGKLHGKVPFLVEDSSLSSFCSLWVDEVHCQLLAKRAPLIKMPNLWIQLSIRIYFSCSFFEEEVMISIVYTLHLLYTIL